LRSIRGGRSRRKAAAESFLTNAVIGLRPVGAIDTHSFEAPGPLTVVLGAAFDTLVASKSDGANGA
jgi:branched-subunit amino acid aminotransferase/4-amino-4-deoxychorismate lyase